MLGDSFVASTHWFTGERQTRLRVWDSGGELIHTYDGQFAWDISWVPGTDRLMWPEGTCIGMFDVATGKPSYIPTEHQLIESSVGWHGIYALEARGNWVASAADEESVQIFSTEDCALVTKVKVSGDRYRTLAWTPQLDQLLISTNEQTIQAFDPHSGELVDDTGIAAAGSRLLCEGQTLAVVDFRDLRCYDMANWSLQFELPLEGWGSLAGSSMTSAGDRIVIPQEDISAVAVVDTQTGTKKLVELPSATKGTAIRDRSFATVHDDAIILWSLDTLEQLSVLRP